MTDAGEHDAGESERDAASADYEAAAQSGDPGLLDAADARLRDANIALAAAERRARRASLPSFEAVLAHPWTQVDGLVYPANPPSSTIDVDPADVDPSGRT